MQITIHIDEKAQTVDIPDDTLTEAHAFFTKIDTDMDRGWQMSRQWVENPNREERCKIAADKILSALSSENQTMVQLMCAYILSNLPEVKDIHIDTSGDMMQTEFS
ncbi:MAG: hypothetical protein ACC707_08770 [Thiohalomonadales bacterium]